jgi:glycosyltransferase involved in cell wall biosynthesis
MRRMVCHLIDSNIETNYFVSIARNHDRKTFPVMIGSIKPPGSLQSALTALGVPGFSLNVTSRSQYLAATLRLARVLRNNKIDILHAHCFDPTFIGLMAAKLAGVPFLFTRHHSDHNIRLGKRWHTRIDGWCARHAGHVIAVSEATRRIMTDIEGAPKDNITVIYNGMEPPPAPTSNDLMKLRLELMLQGEDVCLVVARLHEEKGFRVLFEALPRIQSSVGKLKVLVAGQGPHKTMLEQEVIQRGLSGSVRFLGQRDDVPALISLSSIVLLPSLAESFGFVLLEAMSLGKPVVASTTGGIPEVVADQETGLLVPPGDAGSLALAVSRLLRDPALARAMGEAGRRRSSLFNFDRMMLGYEGIYDQMVPSSVKTRDVRESREVNPV